jgi:predicted lipoprotein with Yx(FWY)xxD motif
MLSTSYNGDPRKLVRLTMALALALSVTCAAVHGTTLHDHDDEACALAACSEVDTDAVAVPTFAVFRSANQQQAFCALRRSDRAGDTPAGLLPPPTGPPAVRP